MKNFTKTLLIAAAVFSFGTANSQIDFGISAVNYPSVSDTIYSNNEIDVTFDLEIFSGTMAQGDSVVIGISSDGVEFASGALYANNNLPAGVYPAALYFNDPGTVANGNFEFCVYTKYYNEVDPSNDSTCATIPHKDGTAPKDFGGVAINSPAANSDINAGSTGQVMVTIENFGEVTLPAGGTVNYILGLCGNNSNLTGVLANDLAPSGTTTRTINVTYPTTVGPCQICVTTAQ